MTSCWVECWATVSVLASLPISTVNLITWFFSFYMKNLIYLCKRNDQTLFRQTLPRFFPVQCCLEPLRQHCIGFFLRNFAPGVLRQYCTRFFLTQCCLEPLTQGFIEFWPVQYCSKSINTKLCRIFSCAMLSGASRSISHRFWQN